MEIRLSKKDYLDNLPISMFCISGTDTVAPHSHEFIEMIYVVSGSAIHKCLLGTKRMTAGDYMFIDFGSVHSFNDKSDDFSVIDCLFTPEYIDETLKNCVHFSDILKNYLVNVFPYEESGIYMFEDSENIVSDRIIFMIKEYENKKRGYVELIRCCLLEIIILSMRNIRVQSVQADDRIKYIVKYINENYEREIYLSDLKDRFYCSTSNISILFKKCYGMTYTQYLQRVRILAACRLLRDSKYSVDNVAEMVGYKDTRYFRKIFKQTMFINPTGYRKRLLNSAYK